MKLYFGDTTPEPESNGIKGVLHAIQSFMTGDSSLTCILSYLEHSLVWGNYFSADIDSVYCTVQADRAVIFLFWSTWS